MGDSIELLTKLFDFYKQRYKGVDLEVKFNEAVYELVKSDDIKISVYIIFCIDNGIEPTIKETTESPTFEYDGWDDSPFDTSDNFSLHGGRNHHFSSDVDYECDFDYGAKFF